MVIEQVHNVALMASLVMVVLGTIPAMAGAIPVFVVDIMVPAFVFARHFKDARKRNTLISV